ncbi:MAG: helix-turn-helix transcriptional regulator [Bacteroidota bacterium]
MQYAEVTPHPSLSNYVDAYWTATGSSAQHSIEKILPDACVDIIFNLGDDCLTDNGAFLMKSEKTYLVGTMTTYKETEMDNNTRLLGVRFKPGAVSAFFKFASLNEITNQTIEPGELLRIDLRKLIKSPFELLNQQLSRNLNRPNLHLLTQIQTIKKSKGQVKIQELAATHYTTVRQLERNFKEHLGITPKEFANLVRYQHAMKAIEQRKPNESILSIAFDFGYYDHSHLTNDFKRYLGCAPTFI